MKKNILLNAIVLVGMFFLTGCATNEYYFNTDAHKGSTSSGNIQVYGRRNLERSYVELGPVTSSISNLAEDTGVVLKREIIKAAREMGADAVIDFRFEGPYGGGCTATGVAVKYK